MSDNTHQTIQEKPTLRIQLLGTFGLTDPNGSVSSLNTPRLQSLFAYLALHRSTPLLRSVVAFALWPDTSEDQAYSSLRKHLHQLRTVLPILDSLIQADNKLFTWTDAYDIKIDVEEYEHAVAQAEVAQRRQDGLKAEELLVKAVDIYRGELLPGGQDEWMLRERNRLHELHTHVLRQLASLLEERGQDKEAIRCTERLLYHSPANEGAYRRLIRLYSRCRDYTSAIQAYHACVAALREDLDVEPDALTQDLYLQLVNRRMEEPSDVSKPVQQSNETLIGRIQEWSQLQSVWKAQSGKRPHLILVSGEAGIGKTKLVQEFCTWSEGEGAVVLTGHCYPGKGSLAFAPIIEILNAAELQPLWKQLHDVWLVELARLLPNILVIHDDLPQPQPLRESWQRQRLFEAITRCVLTVEHSILLFLDDLQWSDDETIEWLHFFSRVERLGTIIVVATVRSEDMDERHALHELVLHLSRTDQLTEIELKPLPASETDLLIAQIAAGELAQSTVQSIQVESEGNPLFAIEMVRAELSRISNESRLATSSTTDQVTKGMPSKVRTVIRSRLGHLSLSARELAFQAAVIGRDFSVEVLTKATQRNDEQLVRDLDELWKRRILNVRGQRAYSFTHDFIRDVAYDEISPMFLAFLHRNAASALAQVHNENMDLVATQIAQHFSLAGDLDEAVTYYHMAAKRELQLCSAQNATHLYNAALEALEQMSPTNERQSRELAIQLELGAAYTAAETMGTPKATKVYLRALELCTGLEDSASMAASLAGLALCYNTGGKLGLAIDYAQQVQAIALQLQDKELLFRSFYLISSIQLFRGEIKNALEAFYLAEADLNISISQSAHNMTPLFSLALFGQGCLIFCVLGQITTFHEKLTNALEYARSTELPTINIYLESMRAACYCLLDDPESAERVAGTTLSEAEKWEAHAWIVHNQAILSWARARQGNSEAVSNLVHIFEQWKALGYFIAVPFYGLLLADAYKAQGQVAESIDILQSLFQVMEISEERWLEAEIRRRLYGLQVQLYGFDKEKLQELQLAIHIARTQNTHLFELRCSKDLALIMDGQGYTEQALRELAVTLAKFDEDTIFPDLLEARALEKALVLKLNH